MTRTITRGDLRDAIERRLVTVVDALPADYYDQQHLPGALNLVEADVAAKAPSLLPDRDAAIVVYCSNTACGNSEAVARLLGRLGYTNVRTYREGIQDWVASGLPVEATVRAA